MKEGLFMEKNSKSYIGIMYIDEKYEIRTVDNCNMALFLQRIKESVSSFEIGDQIYMKNNIRKIFIGNNSGNDEEFPNKENFEKTFCNCMKHAKEIPKE